MSHQTDRFSEDDIVDAQALFDEIRLKHPRLDQIRSCTRSLLASTRKVIARNEQRRAAAKGRPIKLEELWVLPIVGPSGSMKSTSMSMVIDEIYQDKDMPEEDVPILIVTMRGVKNPKAFQAAILERLAPKQASELRSQKAAGYHEDVVNEAIRVQARKRNTAVVVIDEGHSILIYDGGKLGQQMARCIHGLVNEGIFSVIIMGTDKLDRLFKMDDELKSRKVPPDQEADLKVFDVTKAEDRSYFFGFVDRLENQMVAKKVVSKKLGLVRSLEGRAILFDMTGGVLGTVSRILRLAIRRAMQNGRDYLEWNDVEICFQTWNGTESKDDKDRSRKNKTEEFKEPGYDPFKRGVRESTFAAVKADKKQTEPA
jgi:hypothetical protein